MECCLIGAHTTASYIQIALKSLRSCLLSINYSTAEYSKLFNMSKSEKRCIKFVIYIFRRDFYFSQFRDILIFVNITETYMYIAWYEYSINKWLNKSIGKTRKWIASYSWVTAELNMHLIYGWMADCLSYSGGKLICCAWWGHDNVISLYSTCLTRPTRWAGLLTS